MHPLKVGCCGVCILEEVTFSHAFRHNTRLWLRSVKKLWFYRWRDLIRTRDLRLFISLELYFLCRCYYSKPIKNDIHIFARRSMLLQGYYYTPEDQLILISYGGQCMIISRVSYLRNTGRKYCKLDCSGCFVSKIARRCYAILGHDTERVLFLLHSEPWFHKHSHSLSLRLQAFTESDQFGLWCAWLVRWWCPLSMNCWPGQHISHYEYSRISLSKSAEQQLSEWLIIDRAYHDTILYAWSQHVRMLS